MQVGLAHIGVGNFHRAHQGVYCDDLLRAGHTQWGILGVSLASPRAPEQLNPQDGLYSVCTLTPRKREYRVIGSIAQVLGATTPTAVIVRQLADPAIQVITMTVTEKGYHEVADGTRMLPGLLVEVLEARCVTNAPLTLISCDNVSGNGDALKQVTMRLAERRNPTIMRWIEANVSFPNSMVDRIAPQTSAADLANFTAQHGLYDAGHVVCEPFSQWVIEDRFSAERPPWDTVGAQFVASAAAYEQTKLRLLNGTHSACAYLGRLMKLEYVHEVVSDPSLRSYLRRLALEEVAATTEVPADMDATNYVDSVLRRFANAAVPYRNAQVASDGSQKIPQRWRDVLLERATRGLPLERLTFAVSCWLEHLKDPAPDPIADKLQKLHAAHPSSESLVAAVLSETDVFGPALSASKSFANQLSRALNSLRGSGVQQRAAQLA